MPAFDYLSEDAKSALRKGRAIPMFVEHRPREMPDHTLTVVGLLDTRTFQGVFLPDDFSGGELVNVKLSDDKVDVFDLKSDSEDAKVIHELWTIWHEVGRERYLGVVRVIALSLALEQLDKMLASATPVEASVRSSSKQDAKSGSTTSKRREAKGGRAKAAADRKTRAVAKPRKRRSP
jgi:hypothetical protein